MLRRLREEPGLEDRGKGTSLRVSEELDGRRLSDRIVPVLLRRSTSFFPLSRTTFSNCGIRKETGSRASRSCTTTPDLSRTASRSKSVWSMSGGASSSSTSSCAGAGIADLLGMITEMPLIVSTSPALSLR